MRLRFINLQQSAQELAESFGKQVGQVASQLGQDEEIASVIVDAGILQGKAVLHIDIYNPRIEARPELFLSDFGFDTDEFTYHFQIKNPCLREWQRYVSGETELKNIRTKNIAIPQSERHLWFIAEIPQLKKMFRYFGADTTVIPFIDVSGDKRVVFGNFDAIPLEQPFMRCLVDALAKMAQSESFQRLPNWQSIQLGAQNFENDYSPALFTAGEACQHRNFFRPSRSEVVVERASTSRT